jgi:Tol biopolymer transport system component
MTPERLQQIQELYLSARDRDPAIRPGFLAQACGSDDELRREVDSLLAQDSGGVVNRPAVEVAAELLDSGPLGPGVQIGAYRIQSQLGAGGMGEVFRAVDTRLGRAVAIKTCREQFSDRFHREARAISSLNHPHICTLYDVGPNYLVMELVEGETLAARLKRGKLSIEQTIQYGSQIASALAAAHAKGIIHRDLKPGNIMVTKSGVKVLDFGLAKSPQDETLTASEVRLGTPAYMAPEQRDGKECDARTDIYALGLVLREICPKDASQQFMHVVERCLVDDPESRWQAASDVKAELEWAARAQSAVSAAKTPRKWLAWAVVAAFALGLAAVSLLYFRAAPAEARLTYSTVSPPENDSADWNAPVPSPDGRLIVLWTSGKDRLWVRRFDSPAWQPLPGTEHAISPFWSPDSRSLGFFADGKLKRIEIAGGPAEALADAPEGQGGSWSPQGVIVFAPSATGGLQRVAATGGQPAPATSLQGTDDHSHRNPWFLPDGKHFLFQGIAPGITTTLRIGALDSTEVRTVVRASSHGVYSSGYLLYIREDTLMAQPFDQTRLATSGEAVPMAQRVASVIRIGVPQAEFSASGERLLAYRTGAGTGRLQLTWFDRAGRQMGTLGDASDFFTLEFSPDHTSVATSRTHNSEVWIYDAARGLPARFTSSAGSPEEAVWSPDGRSVAYVVKRNGMYRLYRSAVDGSGKEELLYEDRVLTIPSSWSPDGRFLLFIRNDAMTQEDIWALPLEPGPAHAPLRPFPWLVTPSTEFEAKFSPDGRWVAYSSNESNLYEVYVAPFPGPGNRRQISAGGGRFPRWRADGKEIFYVTPDGVLAGAEVFAKETNIEVGAIRPLGVRVPVMYYPYDVSNDGQRFLVTVPLEQKSSASLTLVENWTELLKKK